MVEQVARPGMEHTDHPDTASDEAWIQGQYLQRLCGGAKQDVVETFLVAACQGSQGIGERKGDHKVRERQQETRVVVQPCFGLVILALGTVSILAGVVAVMVLLTWRTVKELAAKSLGATLLDVPYGVKMRGRHAVTELGSVRCAVDAEDVSKLYHHRSQKMRLMVTSPGCFPQV